MTTTRPPANCAADGEPVAEAMSDIGVVRHNGRLEVTGVGAAGAACSRFLERLAVRGLSAFGSSLVAQWMAAVAAGVFVPVEDFGKE
jgi:hypothetical protein